MSFNENGYPTDDTITRIENFDILPDLSNLPHYLNLVISHWEYADWGVAYNHSTGVLELHTAGWSGNESIISAMEKTRMFWSLFWLRSERGGHYYFELFQFDVNGKKCLPQFTNGVFSI